MKVALDGFHVGVKQWTGLGVYTQEISELLKKNHHEIALIYGLNPSKTKKEKPGENFLHSLAQGGPERKDLLQWLPVSLWKMPYFLLKKEFSSHMIHFSSVLEKTPFVLNKLPPHSHLYNYPVLYRMAQFYSCIFGQSTFIELNKNFIPDIFHLTSPLPLSMKKIPKVVTVHDLIPLALPSSVTVPLKWYQKMIHASLKDADLIFSISEHTKKDLIRFFRIPEKKIHITYNSASLPKKYIDLPSQEVETFLEKNFHLEFGKYFLFYGTIEPKKNVTRILHAFNQAKTPYPLIIVGKNGWLYEEVESFFKEQEKENKKKCIRIPYVSFDSLMNLLKGARGLLFPSLYEGFGRPLVEGMLMGCPVITSNVTSLPEVGGDAVHYVNPYSIESLKEAIEVFSEDSDYLRSLKEKGYQRVPFFSPEEHWKRILDGYQKIVTLE